MRAENVHLPVDLRVSHGASDTRLGRAVDDRLDASRAEDSLDVMVASYITEVKRNAFGQTIDAAGAEVVQNVDGPFVEQRPGHVRAHESRAAGDKERSPELVRLRRKLRRHCPPPQWQAAI